MYQDWVGYSLAGTIYKLSVFIEGEGGGGGGGGSWRGR